MADATTEILYLIYCFHRSSGTEKRVAQLTKHLPADEFRCSHIASGLRANRLLDDLRASVVSVSDFPIGSKSVSFSGCAGLAPGVADSQERHDIGQTGNRLSGAPT
jgi:hypothetical protein